MIIKKTFEFPKIYKDDGSTELEEFKRLRRPYQKSDIEEKLVNRIKNWWNRKKYEELILFSVGKNNKSGYIAQEQRIKKQSFEKAKKKGGRSSEMLPSFMADAEEIISF